MIDHVAEDGAFKDHHTPQLYGFQSFISVPIVRADDRFSGTLCAIDPKPARLNKPEIIGMFKLFADMIAARLDPHERLIESRQSLDEERRTAELREQFIAVLGHDLRNPLAAIQRGMRLIEKTALEPAAKKIVGLVDASLWRMASLINDVMDFARGRIGGGLALSRRADPTEPVLRQVISELAVAHPARAVKAIFQIDHPVECDPTRIGQLLSNLAANALTHGASDSPIIVEALSTKEAFEISVSNRGAPISPAAMAKLFLPFERGSVRPSLQGLGLGLYIASEIASAHGGTLTTDSNEERTRFVFRMPRSSGPDTVA